MQEEYRAINFYLRHHKDNIGRAESLLIDKSEYQDLLAPYYKATSQELSEWSNTPYEGNLKYPEQLNQRASNGKYVRSKSEVLIDMTLFMNQIPFRYECALELGGMIFYPDFTIRHPKTGEVYYWEHFGKMDNFEYAKTACFKLQQYIANGIFPGEKLIISFETKNHQLSLEEVEYIVKEYFL